MPTPLHGLPSHSHDAMDVSAFLRRANETILTHQYTTIIDAFAGGGRDTAIFQTLLHGNGQFVAIDYDDVRIADMLAKPQFSMVASKAELDTAFGNRKIAAIKGSFPDHPFGDTDIDFTGMADMVYCCAGIMFIKPEELDMTLAVLTSLLRVGGTLVLRFSGERDDKIAEYGKTYFLHEINHITAVLEQNNTRVERHPDLADAGNRPITWLDFSALKLG